MSNKTMSDIITMLYEDEKFKRAYLYLFLDRFVYTTTELDKDLTTGEKTNAIERLSKAFDYITSKEGLISYDDIINVGNIVNEGLYSGFRKVDVSAGKYAKWTPVPKEKIYYQIYSILDNYYNVINGNNYYKEAYFHINMMRTHPFEDGNKRTFRLIMNANLMKNNLPPVIITEDETEKYYEYLNNIDIEHFADYLKQKSNEEFQAMVSTYKLLNDVPIEKGITDYLNEQVKGR